MSNAITRTLVVGRVPQRILDRIGCSDCDVLKLRNLPPEREICPAERVVVDASFPIFDYLKFAQFLLAVREAVSDGGFLAFVHRCGVSDSFFVYRDDEFFRNEFAALWEVDFENSERMECDGHIVWLLRGRRPLGEAEEKRAALPWNHLARLFTFASDNFPMPNYAWVPATFRCNLRCLTCSVRNSPPGKDLSDDLIDRIFDTVGASLEVVNVTGIGEPFFSRTWQHLRRRIRERPYRRLEIVTNGMLLTEDEVRDMMRPENPTILVVSIDGARKETFEYIRDRARWDKLTATMDMIARLRRELNPGPLFSLGVDFVAIKDNVAELLELIPRLAEWSVDLLLVIEMGDWEVNRDFYREQALRFYPRLANEYYNKARALAAQYPFRLVSIPPNYSEEVIRMVEADAKPCAQSFLRRCARAVYHKLRRTEVGRRIFSGALALLEWYCEHPFGVSRKTSQWLQQQVGISRRDGFGDFGRVRGFCEVVAERAYFHINGDIAICCGLMAPIFGNIAKEDFVSVWNSPTWREFRIRNLFGFPHTSCYYCTLPYGLPEKNPENFMAAHRLSDGQNWLAHALRRWRTALRK